MVMNYSGSKRVDTNYYGFVSLLLFLILSCATAQSPPNLRGPDSQYEYANFSPSMAIILVILIAALFFMGFFSIYIRNCSQSATGNSIRQALSMRLRAAARGLDASVLQTFPTFTYAEVKDHHYGKEALECAICLNEFEDIEMLRLIPKCDHVFHPECVDAWLESHVTCPVCRADLTPQPDDPPVLVPVLNQQQNEEVSIHIVSQIQQQQAEEGSVNNQGTNQAQEEGSSKSGSNRNRKWPSRSFSMKRPRMFSKFRSHSTGHSLVVPGENLERYTLRLPEDVRKEVMNRAWLNRTKSCAVRSGNEEGSSRGGRSYRRIERNEPEWKSDRWVFTLFSTAKPDNEGSTSRGVKMPSFKCLEPKGDEASLVSSDTARPPV